MQAISRREAIKKAALLVGGALALPDVLKAWGNLSIDNPNFRLSAGQEALLAEIAETIVPATDTPGAKAAGVPAFIQKIVADCYEEKDRNDFFAGLNAVDAEAFNRYSQAFAICTEAQRTNVLKSIEARRSEMPFWGQIKDLTVTGYFTSEIGCTKALRYEAVPGRFDGEYPYKKGDKAWAT